MIANKTKMVRIIFTFFFYKFLVNLQNMNDELQIFILVMWIFAHVLVVFVLYI